MASNVPKFRSFRPKPTTITDVANPPGSGVRVEGEDQFRERRRERSRDRNEDRGWMPSGRSEVQNEDRRAGFSKERKGVKTTTSTSHEQIISKRHEVVDSRTTRNNGLAQDIERSSRAAQSSTHSLFVVDRKGDPSNLKYGTIDRYSVPSYRRYGYGSVLGDSRGLKIDRDLSTSKQVVLLSPLNRQQGRPLASKYAPTQNVRLLRLIKAEKGSQPQQDMDFIELSRTTKRRRQSDSDSYGTAGLERLEEQDTTYDSDLEYESEAVQDPHTAEITQKTALLTQASHDRPEDLQIWLDLIDHQAKILILNHKALEELSPTEQRHLAELRISIYEQALRKIGKNETNQIKLQMGLLDEAAKIWEHERLSSRWKDLIARYSSNIEVWTRYLNFIQTNFPSFKYEQCRISYQSCLEAIKQSPLAMEAEYSLFILIRMTSMIQQAGYQELALAIWQAILEFKLLRPRTGTDQGLLGLFEEFWDSEVSRVGEPDAKGWAAFDAETSSAQPALLVSLDPSTSQADSPEDFRLRETEHINNLRFPGRTADEVGEDDPFHMILFSDIEPFLQSIPQDTSRETILSAFLCYCGLPPLAQKASSQSRWRADPVLYRQIFNAIPHQETSPTLTQTANSFMRGAARSFQMSTKLLFDHGFENLPTDLDLTYIRNTLQLLAADATFSESLGEYLLAFELRFFTSEVTRTAKQILKLRPMSLRLYNAYGLVESHIGNSKKANLVFSTALTMNKGAPPFATSGSLELFSSWVWEALHTGKRSEALWRLVSPQGQLDKDTRDEGSRPPHSSIARARSVLLQGRESELLRQDFDSAIRYVELLTLLQYLLDDCNVDAALVVLNELSDWFMQHNMFPSAEAEIHAQGIVQFLTYHAQTAAIVKPSLLRGALEPLITTFPNNAILLAAYAANERRFSINDRVRGIVHDKVLSQGKATNISGWFFAIQYEMSRSEIAGSTSHSVRALFRRAAEDVGAHCPGIWISHVLFELEQVRKEREKRPPKKSRRDGSKRKEETRLEETQRMAKETFFMGMQRLPWCKEYHMLAFTHLKEGILTREELRKVYDVMMEKELRLYVELPLADK